jgi:hypothetical protein
MQKLTGISSGKNNKSCSIIHNGSKKMVLHFSVIFYAIYKNQEITFTIGVHLLQQGPGKILGFAMWSLGGPAGVARRN